MSNNYSIRHNARLVSVAGNYAVGTVLVVNSDDEHVIATSANRTLYGPSVGIMRTAGDGTRNRAVDVQFCGIIPASIAGVGTGTAEQWVRVSAAGVLERVTSPGAGDDVVGKADAAGNVKSLFGGLINTSSGGGTPAGGTGAVQYNNAGAFGGIAPPAAAGTPLQSNGAGVAPSFSSISLANNAAVVAPGAAQELLVNDGTGAVSFADEVRAGANYLSIGTNPAATGGGRLANNVAWKARNAANSADRQLCVLNGSDVVVIGDTNVAMTLDASASGVTIPTCLKVGAGTFAALAGVRFTSGAQVFLAARNAGNTDDTHFLAGAGSNTLYIGTDTGFTAAKQVDQLFLRGGSFISLGVGGAGYMVLQSDTITCGRPLVGYAGINATFRFKRSAIAKNDATDLTLSAAQYECPILNFTGTPGGNFNVIAPDSEGTFFIIKNSTANVLTIKKSGGTGVTVAGSGGKRIVYHDGTDYDYANA